MNIRRLFNDKTNVKDFTCTLKLLNRTIITKFENN